jgi:hypothetical protein
MRTINTIVVHHSASASYVTADTIRKWHMARGWSDIGYHVVIEQYGRMVSGRSFDIPGAHVKGSNSDSLGICVVGDNTKPAGGWSLGQIESLITVLDILSITFPEAVVMGHRDMPDAATECPGLDVRKLLDLP